MRLMALGFLIFAGLAAPVAAAGLYYDCDLRKTSSGKGWVAQKVAIIVTKDGRVLVSDGHVLRIHGEPIAAKSAKDTPAALVVRWSLRGMKDKGNQRPPAVNYRAKITKKSGAIAISARPSDAPQNFNERGTCKTRAAK